MAIRMPLHVAGYSSAPLRRQLTEPLEQVVEGGGVPPDQALSSIRELAGLLDPNTITRAIETLQRSGYRPLHSRPEPRDPSSIQAGTSTGLDAKEDGAR